MDNFNREDNIRTKGVASQTTTPKAKTTKHNFKNNSSSNQCIKILDWLFEKGSITFTEAHDNLEIMSPASRILQLKQVGYLTTRINDTWTSEHGINHKGLAHYLLTQKELVETAINNKVEW